MFALHCKHQRTPTQHELTTTTADKNLFLTPSYCTSAPPPLTRRLNMATTADAEILEETHHQPTLKPNWDETCESFDGLNLREELLKGVYAYGFERPSSIQQLAIVPMIGVPRAWPLLGTSADAALHWSPLVHQKARNEKKEWREDGWKKEENQR